jgi:hypothetical protein
MPDLECFYYPSLMDDGRLPGKYTRPEDFKRFLKDVVARSMDCKDDEGELIVHTTRQIKILHFEPYADPDFTDWMVLIIEAYDWPDRMLNIDERLGAIVEEVGAVLRTPADTVAASFRQLARPTRTQRTTWVRR